MGDYVICATAGNGAIRAYAATTSELVQHARAVSYTHLFWGFWLLKDKMSAYTVLWENNTVSAL